MSETDNIARGNHVVPTEWAQQLERERDQAVEEVSMLPSANCCLLYTSDAADE